MDITAELTRIEQVRASGRAAEAEAMCRRLLAQSQNSPGVLNSLALMVRDRGDHREAETLLHKAIAAAPREAALFNNLGNVQLSVDNLAAAESAYRKAVALNPNFAEAYFNLGNTLHRLNRPEQALAAQRRAVAIRPNYAEALVELAVLQSEAGSKTEALKTLDAAIAANPQLFGAHYYRGTIQTDLNRFEDAIPALKTAVQLIPQRFEGHFALAKALAHAGREDEALSAYQHTIQLAPEFEPAHVALNELSWSMGRDIRDAASYAFARKSVGDKPDLLLSEAELHMRFKAGSTAETLLRRASEIAPQRADVANALGRSLVLQSRFEESLPFYRLAIAAEPASVSHRQELGVALLKQGRPREAIPVLEDALALTPNEQVTLAYLVLALREIGDSRYDELVQLDRFVKSYDLAPPTGYTDTASFNLALRHELELRHTRRVAPLNQTLLNGTQTPGSLFANRSAALDGVHEQIHAAVKDYIAGLPDDAAHPFLSRKNSNFSFAGSWSCRLRSSGYHSNHVHNEGWISSAYYVALPQEVRTTTADDGALKFSESKFALGERDRPERLVHPAVGKLVLFPSYFWHGTIPFTSQESRLTIAFDVLPGPSAVAPGEKRL